MDMYKACPWTNKGNTAIMHALSCLRPVLVQSCRDGYHARFSDGKWNLRNIFTSMMLDYHVCVCAIIGF